MSQSVYRFARQASVHLKTLLARQGYSQGDQAKFARIVQSQIIKAYSHGGNHEH